MGSKSLLHALCLVPRFVNETSREKGSPATERARARRIGTENAIAGPHQHALGGTHILRLKIAVEGIDQQDNLFAGARGRSAIGMARPVRQFSIGAESEQ